jgi:hypothetical protein
MATQSLPAAPSKFKLLEQVRVPCDRSITVRVPSDRISTELHVGSSGKGSLVNGAANAAAKNHDEFGGHRPPLQPDHLKSDYGP